MMYPSSNNGNDLISNYPIQPFRPFPTESNPCNSSSKQELELQLPNYALSNNNLPPFSFFQFPYSPFEDNSDINFQPHRDDLLVHHQSPPLPEPALRTVDSNKAPGTSGDQIPAVKSRRSSKRDRHSKIKTARGLRDRRMRLSLEVAKRFFGLQDMLGFDKASKTVEWLLNQAKGEIKQLARDTTLCAKSSSSTSECEGVSSLEEGEPAAAAAPRSVKRSRATTSSKAACRRSPLNPIDKESRERARERARERTREKKKMVVINQDDSKAVATTLSNLGSSIWNPFEPEAEHDDSFVVMPTKWSPNIIFNSALLQEHQFGEFQSIGKPWEPYTNRI